MITLDQQLYVLKSWLAKLPYWLTEILECLAKIRNSQIKHEIHPMRESGQENITNYWQWVELRKHGQIFDWLARLWKKWLSNSKVAPCCNLQNVFLFGWPA